MNEVRKAAAMAMLKGTIANAGPRGMALAALMREIERGEGELKGATQEHGVVDGHEVGIIRIEAQLYGEPVMIGLTMPRALFDCLWVQCNLKVLLPDDAAAGVITQESLDAHDQYLLDSGQRESWPR